MTRPTVLILGAAGRIGAACVQAFAAAGWRVRAHRRRAPAEALPSGASLLDTPLADTATLAARAAGASVVVYAVNPPYTRWDAELLPLARQGMDVAERLGALFLLPGNVYNFGAGMPPQLREDTPQRPTTTKGRQRCELEAEMAARCHGGRLRGVVVRAGDFYGSGQGSWLDQAIVKSIASGRLVYPGPPDLLHAWAYLPDLARAFVAVAALRGRPAFEVLHFEGHGFTGRELLAHIERAGATLGLNPHGGWRHGGLPWGLIRAVGLLHAPWRELARMRYLWQVPHTLDGMALAQAVGPLVPTPPAEAVREALRSLGIGRATRPVAAPGPAA